MLREVRYSAMVLSFIVLASLMTAVWSPCVQGTVTEEWVRVYDDSGHGSDAVQDIAMDPWGNVIVTGTTPGADGTYTDITTICYDPAGDVAWMAVYDGPANNADHGAAVACDPWGNTYVAGHTETGTVANDLDLVLICYDPIGAEMWTAFYNSQVGGVDRAVDVGADSWGNIYVGGYCYASGAFTGPDYLMVAFDNAGGQLWEGIFDGPAGGGDHPEAIAVSDTGLVYMTGRTWSPYALGFDMLTVAYDYFGGGTLSWYHVYNSPADGYYDRAYDCDTDMFGNVYVTGQIDTGPGSGYDMFTISYDPAGGINWMQGWDGPAGDADSAEAIDVTPAGDVFITGYTKAPSQPHSYATVAYNSDGEQQWEAYYDGPASGIDTASDVHADIWGNVFVTGKSLGVGTFADMATVAYAPDGTEMWVMRYEGEVGGGTDFGMALVPDGTFNLYLTGQSQSSYGLNKDYVTIKYSWVAPTTPVLDHLDSAADNQESSYSSEFWVDGTHLDPQMGHRMFEERKKVVMELMWVMEHGGAGREDQVVYQTAVEEGVEEARGLAATLHDEVQRTTRDPRALRQLENCREDMADGDEALLNAEKDGTPDPRYDKAMDHYKSAWLHAQLAMKHAG